LGGDELTTNTDGSGPVVGTRYYPTAGGATVVRSGNGALVYMTADHHGTPSSTLDAATLTATRRQSKPFGEARGPRPTQANGQWPDDKGFLGKPMDATGLTHVGAREYDPGLGRFISVDPIMDLTDAQQMHGYTYSNNNPLTFSDPSSLDYCPSTVCKAPLPPYNNPGHEGAPAERNGGASSAAPTTPVSTGGGPKATGTGRGQGISPEHASIIARANVIMRPEISWNFWNSLYWQFGSDKNRYADRNRLRLDWIRNYNGFIAGAAYEEGVPEEVLAGIAYMEIGGPSNIMKRIIFVQKVIAHGHNFCFGQIRAMAVRKSFTSKASGRVPRRFRWLARIRRRWVERGPWAWCRGRSRGEQLASGGRHTKATIRGMFGFQSVMGRSKEFFSDSRWAGAPSC
ncbi:RHS repeat domain-containing protein, partial [Embleya sp. NPDC050493]|uniref:RHS repeat domain-containing protein n=1 Tax=Embleya sp. NPDC050493 TaxID=3363989 RepID=UPI0037B20062